MSADAWDTCPRCLTEWMLREDYEFWGANTGAVKVDYRAECQECGLTLEFHDVYKFDLNQPDRRDERP